MISKLILPFIFLTAICSACGQSAALRIPVGLPATQAAPHEQVAYFAEGCFWHSELVFQSLEGVRDAVSGYAGGHYANPDYEKVCTGVTGHAETVQVFYDSSVISYTTLLRAFFASMDPTQVNGQGNDRGTQYRSIAFYATPGQQKLIKDEIDTLTGSGKYRGKIATQVLPLTRFYKAEDEHQEYISRNPGNAYVRGVSIPEWLAIKSSFPARYKQ